MPQLGDLVFGISLINYTSEFAEPVQEKFSKFKNIEIPKAINYELLVYYLYGDVLTILGSSLWILDSSKILPILSENRGGFCSFLYGIEIGASDFSFLGLTVLFGNKGFRQLVLRICRFLSRNFSGSWTHRKFGMVSHRNPRLTGLSVRTSLERKEPLQY
ncbi:hypothetical protein GLOIN_2v1786202 [Rhizophagus irregularis DAOM 181602=DAOM 197198]|nr:hypothetical protein GLOIN_2v1786202 [Rhizophagus irregularis DAOM 181602=DAOM 197198]